MPSRSARGTSLSPATSGSELRLELDRLLQKERFKDAVKQAKLVYKQESSPENHKLLERTYFLRAQQLVQGGMAASAVEVAQHLLDFGVTASEWVDDFVVLLTTLGLNKDALAIQERLGSPEKKDLLALIAADQAVIHPERQKDSSSEIARDAALIRGSLDRLQANDEAGALQSLRDLARSSILSEWKFFVRGLAAYHRGDADETAKNWNRLDTRRKAFPITQRLLRLKETPGGGKPDAANFKTLETLAFGEPVLDRLRQLCGFAANKEWDHVTRLLGPLKIALQRVDPTLAERLTGALIGSVIKEAEDLDLDDAERLVHGFSKAAEPLSFDPRWNRLWAMLWDGPQGDASVALEYWSKYVDDLKTVTTYNSTERALAQALVCNHMAQLHRDEAADLADGPGPFGLPTSFATRPKNSVTAINRAKKSVINCLEKSLELAPDHLPTYQLLVEAYRGWDDTTHLETAAQRLLKKFPQDLDTLQLLAKLHTDNNDLESALPLAQQARALKPLDESLRKLEWFVRVGLARVYAIAKKWDAGRNEFAIAEQLLPDCRNEYHYLARKVVFEAKASERELSDQYLAQAQAALKDPTPLWLALAIEAIRFRMTKATQKTYAQQWEAGLDSKCSSETAGELASLMHAFLASAIEYPGRAGHIKKVVAYLQRTSRLKYRRVDIERVVEFLGFVEGKDHLLEKMVKLGVKQHPQSVLLNFRAGLIEPARGLLQFGSARGRGYLETARKLAETSSDPQETEMLPAIQNALTLFNEMGMGPLGFPSFGDGPSRSPFPPALDQFFDFFDDDFDDDDDPGPRRPAKPRSPSGPKKKSGNQR